MRCNISREISCKINEIKFKSIKEVCETFKLSYVNVCKFRREHKKLSDTEVIEHFLNIKNRDTLKEKAERAGIKPYVAYSIRHNHTELKTDEEVIEYCLRDKKSFAGLCRQSGVNPGSANVYRQKHSELTDEEVIEHYLKPKIKTFKDKCIERGIPEQKLKSLYLLRKNNPNLSDEQVIEKYIGRGRSISNICTQLGLSNSTIMTYKSMHPELSDKQVTMHYRPDCYINLLGELVIPN